MSTPLRTLVSALLLPLSALAACEVAEIPSPSDGRDVPRDTADTQTSGDTFEVGDGLVACDPAKPSETCAAGQFCETTAHVCVDCVGYAQRCVGDAASAKRETCEAPKAQGLGMVEGGFFLPDACPSGEVCVAGPVALEASCAPKVCEAGFSTCVSGGRVQRCNASGTEQTEEACGPGRACYQGTCEFIRHNVLLVFDTSGSMWNYLDKSYSGTPFTCQASGAPCLEDFPLCDDPADPLTLLTLSKNVFADVVDEAIGGFAQYALARFPQYESPQNPAGCMVGWYGMAEKMTGDDDGRDTTAATWFADNLGEVIAVPFPVRQTLSNSSELLSWLDNDEGLGATQVSCTKNDDCGARGKCGDFNGERRCFAHSDPELRAGGQTPLGKSLFYAGEYLRRYVRVDGKACTTDASCGSAGYVCKTGKCVDPYRKCKDDFIVLFTDGDESQYIDEGEFFNPVVQAKRLAFGLECQGDGDCRGGSTCTEGMCLGPAQNAANMPRVEGGTGTAALSSPDGQPISVRTTVITLDGLAGRNQRIAFAGGGVNIDVVSGDPQGFRQTLLQAMTPNFKCLPEDIEDLGNP